MDGDQSAWFYSGRVEVRQANGSWGTICDDQFDNREASVICKMFGYPKGIARPQAYFGQGTGLILMDDVECNGNEMSIFDCSYRDMNNHNCGHGEDSGVECSVEGE